MTTITPAATESDFTGTGTIHNPATGAVAGQVQWTDPADVSAIEHGLSASVFSKDFERAKEVALQLDCGAVNINDVITNLMCTTAPMGGWKTSGIGTRFGGADGLRKFCRVETVIAPRTNVGASPNYYHNSHKALTRINKLMTRWALSRPRRVAK